MSEPVQISHDAFARQSIMRRAVMYQNYGYYGVQCSCANCGQPRQRGGKPVNVLWQYGTRADDSIAGRINWHDKAFCSKSCHDSYHGG